ncbi:MAG: amino acid dehydrogenase, partial [Haliea sp.]
ADINEVNLRRAVEELGVLPVSADEIMGLEVDILAPCALGAVLHDRSISALRAGIVAGAANNQLETAEDSARLQDHGILYCPDFLINAGGIIDVHHQRIGSPDTLKRLHVERIERTLSEVLLRADATRQPTHDIAEDLAREYLRSASTLSETAPALRAAS